MLHEHEVDRDVYLLLRLRFAKCSGPACTAVVALLVVARVMVHVMQHGSPAQPTRTVRHPVKLRTVYWLLLLRSILIESWRYRGAATANLLH